MNPESSKIGARCNLGSTLDSVMKFSNKMSENDRMILHHEVAISFRNLTSRNVGCQNVIKNGGVNHLVDLFESMQKNKDNDGMKAVLLASQRLVQKDRNQSDAFFKRGLVTKICNFAREHQEDPDLYVGKNKHKNMRTCISRETNLCSLFSFCQCYVGNEEQYRKSEECRLSKFHCRLVQEIRRARLRRV